DAVGIRANDYQRDKAVQRADELYTGWAEIRVKDPAEMTVLPSLAQKGKISADCLAGSVDLQTLFPNQCCQIYCGEKYLLAVYKKAKGLFEHVAKPLKTEDGGKIKPANDRQALLSHLLRDPSIPIVTVLGTAGTGKSLIAFWAGYDQFRRNVYESLLVYKPIVEVGERTLGLLPGDLQEKMEPWKLPIYDSFNLILGNGNGSGKEDGHFSARDVIEEYLQKGMMEIAPLSHIRGRSLNRSFIIVEETQNLSPHEVKTVVTRLAKGSKIVLVGDVEQIDNPYLSATSTGLSRAVEITKDSELAGHITLTECKRSDVAALFANLM
ncbi:MAG: PhoH family protein, partial [bacterium]|nr:PhoH family protein [bacterium]